MRIINQSDIGTSGIDPERMDALEKMVSTIFQRLQAIEDRIKTLEEAKPVQQARTPIYVMPEPRSEPIVVTQPEPAATPEAIAAAVPMPAPTPTPTPTHEPAPTVEPLVVPMAFQGSLDAEAIRKGLLTKMWKYLNEKQAA